MARMEVGSMSRRGERECMHLHQPRKGVERRAEQGGVDR